MKVTGMRDFPRWAARMSNGGADVRPFEGVEVEAVVFVDSAHFDADTEQNHRPTIRLSGVVKELHLFDALAFGVDTIDFEKGFEPMVSGRYDFSGEQLAELVSRGYFTSGYEVPDTMRQTEYELPLTISGAVVAPETQEDHPVVFVELDDNGRLPDLTMESTGYDLVEYLPDRSGEFEVVPEGPSLQSPPEDYSDQLSQEDLILSEDTSARVAAQETGEATQQEEQADWMLGTMGDYAAEREQEVRRRQEENEREGNLVAELAERALSRLRGDRWSTSSTTHPAAGGSSRVEEVEENLFVEEAAPSADELDLGAAQYSQEDDLRRRRRKDSRRSRDHLVQQERWRPDEVVEAEESDRAEPGGPSL